MKILALRLTAFGPFTNRDIDLSAGNHGLHVVFGLNEAGKTSALRALHALLYRIPLKTTDAFLHPNDRLRLGGHLRLSDGQEIEFVRRKGSKSTLLAPDNSRLDDHVLDRFLAGVSPEAFQMFWGIDHERLLRGGREILEGHGDLGESLFAAGSGVSDLRGLRARLDEDAETLFTPQGHTRLINKGIIKLKECKNAQREVTVLADEWSRRERAVREAETRLAESTSKAEWLSREKSRLERMKRVLPLLAEREVLRGRLSALGDVALLAADFPKRRQGAEMALRTAHERLERTEPRIREQQSLVEMLGPASALTAESEIVNSLHQRLGSHRKALSDRPGLIGKGKEQRAVAQRLLTDLWPDIGIENAESLRVYVGRRARIHTLAAERARLDERLAAARRRQKEARERAETLAADAALLPPPRNSDALIAAIEESRRRGDAETTRDSLAQTITRLTAKRASAVERLGIDASALEQLEEQRVPSVTAIAHFERISSQRESDDRAAQLERERITKAAREVTEKIDALRKKRDVPTEDALHSARVRRDTAFRLLRDQWENGRDVIADAQPIFGDGKLIDLYPDTVKVADEVVDRLRSEAERVAELAQYLDEQESIAKQLSDHGLSDIRRGMATQELATSWHDVWKDVLRVPPPIYDAREWRGEFDRMILESRTLVEARQQRDELEAWIAKQIAALRSSIIAVEPTAPNFVSLAAAVSAADKVRQRLEKESSDRNDHVRQTRETEKAIRTTAADVLDAETDVESWQCRWNEAVLGLMRPDTPHPDDALVAVEAVEKILRAVDEANVFEARVAGIDRDAESFCAEVRALAERLGEAAAIKDGSEDRWIEALHARLAVTAEENERRRQEHQRLVELRASLAKDQESVADANVILSALRQEAKCGTDAELPTAEESSSLRRACQADLIRIDKDLIRSGDGASMADLESEAAAADKDGIDARLGQISLDLHDLGKTISEAHDIRAAAQADFRLLHGPSVASDRAEDTQATIARLREDVLSFARLRVASTMLSRRIDDYRRENQAPLLLRAGALFKELTIGAFDQLDADMEEGRPVIVGVRPDGARVPTTGMSAGTIDQLFLSLRLAAVEASSMAGEPMPFVVDDVLIQFDDDRSAAAFRVLRDLSAHTQVVLFTHHGRDREYAERLSADGDVFVHDL